MVLLTLIDQHGDLGGVVGQDTPSAPRPRPPSMPSILVRSHPQECLRYEMRPSDPVRHLTSLRKTTRQLDRLALSTGASLPRDGDVSHAEGVQIGLHLRFAITAIGGGGPGHLGEPP